MKGSRYDIVIQGAGMVGLTLAVAVARSGARTALVDRVPAQQWRGGEVRQRVSALNVASERWLRRLGVWDAITGVRAGRFEAVSAEDGEGGARVRFEAADVGEPHLGHIVENELVCAMLDRAAEQAGVERFAPAAVEDWRSVGQALELGLSDGRRLATRLLVGADGASSSIREQAGIRVRRAGYGQEAVVATVTTGAPHGGVARQRFLRGGPVAFLPLADGRCSIVWSLPKSEAETVTSLGDEAFIAMLADAAGDLVGGIEGSGPRARFPLARLHAERYIGERLALVGDAAHVIHPLAGQGANLGLRDAATLADEVYAAVDRGDDPGGVARLRRFERSRRGDNLLMQFAMDAFHEAFTRHDPALVAVRGAGFRLTERLAPVRRRFMRQAMGLTGELPVAMR